MAELIHHEMKDTKADPVDGSFTMRCGLKGWPLGVGLYDNGNLRFARATSERTITCPNCRIKLNGGQRRFVRVLFQHGPWARITTARGFSYSTGGGLRVWARQPMLNALVAKSVLVQGVDRWCLTRAGREVAAAYPQVEEEF